MLLMYCTHRFNNGFVIAAFVGSKPVAVIVFLKFIEESEKVFWETSKFCHCRLCYLK